MKGLKYNLFGGREGINHPRGLLGGEGGIRHEDIQTDIPYSYHTLHPSNQGEKINK